MIYFKKDGGRLSSLQQCGKLDTVQCGIGNIWSANVASF